MYPGAHVDRFPDKHAVRLDGTDEALTYRQLEDRSRALARYLYDAGLRPGDHLALLSTNHPRVFEVYWAAVRSGLYLTVVNRHLTAEEAAYIVRDCGARAVVVNATVTDLATAVASRTPDVALRLAWGGAVAGHGDYDAALDAASPLPLPSQPRGTDMLYSSGTTGRPKGVKAPLSGKQVDEEDPAITAFGALYRFDADTVYLSPGPVYHAAPLRYCALTHICGGTVVLMERFEPEAALAAVARHRATHSQWVPTMFVRMLKLDPVVRARYDLSSLRVAVHAAAPCPVEVKRAMIDWWGPILFEYYAATEANGMTFIDSEQWLRKPGSVGLPALGELRICAEDGTVLPTGEIGTVYFARDVRPFSYHNDEAKTAEATHPEHATWTTTGDIGYTDEDGFLFLTDRRAFTIISGGVNIYPREIEDALTLHPAVDDVAVIGVPDEEMGESVLAVVAPAPGATPGPELAAELTGYLRERIAGYKVPRTVDFRATLPRSEAGKLVKHVLRAQYTVGQ